MFSSISREAGVGLFPKIYESCQKSSGRYLSQNIDCWLDQEKLDFKISELLLMSSYCNVRPVLREFLTIGKVKVVYLSFKIII